MLKLPLIGKNELVVEVVEDSNSNLSQRGESSSLIHASRKSARVSPKGRTLY